jgi:signal transduction histidine kinase/ligand-binding sensor domain-containing protein
MVSWTPPPGQQLPGSIIQALLGARDGTLWIATIGGLASWKNGQLTQYPVLSGFFAAALLEDRDGAVWAAGGWGKATRRGKLCAIRGESATCYGDDGSLGTGVSCLYEDAGGGLWAGTGTGLWRFKPGPPIRYAPGVIPTSITQGEKGSGLAVSVGGEVRQIAGGKVENYPLPGAPSPLTAGALLRDRHGAFWVGTSRGLVYAGQGTTRLINHSDGLSSNPVHGIMEDREGTIWICTSDGLDSFRKLPVASLSITEGLSNNSVHSVLAARDGSIWIGTAIGLNRWKNGSISVYRVKTDPALPGDEIGTLFEDERGQIWVETSRGVATFEAGRFRGVTSAPRGAITAIASDYHGGLWLQLWANPNDYGLVHLVNGKVIEEVPWKDLGAEPGAGLVVDPDGGVWTGLFNGGIDYLGAGQIRRMHLSGPGIADRRVFNIFRARDGALWVAGEAGLTRFANGRAATLTTANGLPCDVVHWMIDDDVSSYWLFTVCGLVRIARSELEAWIADPKRKIQPTVFDSADGVPLVGMLGPDRPHVTKSTDGRIWFENGNKVMLIDPSNIGLNTIPPPVHIEQITADGKTYDARPGLRLPALIRNVTIDYTALSLAAPAKVRFRYKLEGQDPEWREVLNDREVQYSNLPPAAYRFRVTACNNSGIWNDKGDVLEFNIDPAYYQTGWFTAAVAGFACFLLWAIYRYRLHLLTHEYNVRLEERVEERTRIARDLHDTLLQTFQGLMLRFQVVDELLPPGKAKDELQETLECGDQAVIEARNAVHHLRKSTTTSNDLAEALRALGDELAGTGGTTFRMVMEGPARDLHPIVRDELYGIAREALRNAFTHAGASHIELEITFGEPMLRMRIRDDGGGIAPEILEQGRDGHYGLTGMRERARQIGSKLVIWSAAGSGTEIELIVAGSIAYLRPPRRSRFSFFRKMAG